MVFGSKFPSCTNPESKVLVAGNSTDNAVPGAGKKGGYIRLVAKEICAYSMVITGAIRGRIQTIRARAGPGHWLPAIELQR